MQRFSLAIPCFLSSDDSMGYPYIFSGEILSEDRVSSQEWGRGGALRSPTWGQEKYHESQAYFVEDNQQHKVHNQMVVGCLQQSWDILCAQPSIKMIVQSYLELNKVLLFEYQYLSEGHPNLFFKLIDFVIMSASVFLWI